MIAELHVYPRAQTRAEQNWLGDTFRRIVRMKPSVRRDPGRPPRIPRDGLTARCLRELRLGEAKDEARDRLRELEEHIPGRLAESGFSAEALAAPRRPGSRGRDDRFYAEVANAYVEANERHDPAPVATAARMLSDGRGEDLKRDYVRDLLHEARRRDLLTKPPKGEAGGKLTEKGKRALETEA